MSLFLAVVAAAAAAAAERRPAPFLRRGVRAVAEAPPVEDMIGVDDACCYAGWYRYVVLSLLVSRQREPAGRSEFLLSGASGIDPPHLNPGSRQIRPPKDTHES